MEFLWRTDWERLFLPEMSLLEILLRGTFVYLALCILLRIVLKRQAGKVSLSDLLVVTLVAGVCRNPLIKDAYSVTDGVLVVAVVLVWSYALDWLSFHFPAVHRILHPPAVPLIQDGHILHDKLDGELMTESQLGSKLRRKGVATPDDVAEALMEGDGHVSVIKMTEAKNQRKQSGHDTANLPSQAPNGHANGSFSREQIEALKEAMQHLIDQMSKATESESHSNQT
jgi:uncharacterized membrane protein YcaP (DUF421 family)